MIEIIETIALGILFLFFFSYVSVMIAIIITIIKDFFKKSPE